MKNSVKWAIIAVLLVAIIGGSTVLYNTLSKDYKVNNIVVYSSDKETAENDASDENVSSTEAVTSTENATSSDKTSSAEKTGSTGKTSSTPKNSSTNKTSSTPKSSSQVKPSSEVTTTTSTPEEEAFVGDFTVEDMNGNKVKLSDFLGKPIVLNFWTSWCGYCKQEMPDFDRAAKENPNVAFVMVNITRDSRETIGKAKAYVRSNNFENLNFYFDVDKEAAIEYQVRAYPSTYFFNTDGTLVAGAESSLSYEELIDCMKLITPIK